MIGKFCIPFSTAAIDQTLMLMQKGKGLPSADYLKIEVHLCQHIVQDPNSDFYEGVRAVLVDKGKTCIKKKESHGVMLICVPLKPSVTRLGRTGCRHLVFFETLFFN